MLFSNRMNKLYLLSICLCFIALSTGCQHDSDHGNDCEDGACDCTDGEVSCDDNTNTPLLCQGGKFVPQTECSEDTVCQSSTGKCVCIDGQTSCSGNTPTICRQGKFEELEPCSGTSICEAGQCMISLKNGDACESDFKTLCQHEKYYQCSPRTHQIVVTDCKSADGFSCIDDEDNQYCLENDTEMARFTQADYDEFDMFIEQTLEKSGLYAMAVGIIRNNEVVYKKGFGRVSLDENSPAVTTQTLFPIMSMTKNMTSYMAAKLVSEGTMDWDDPIVKHLSAFHSTDENFTQTATIRQGFSHSTGIKGRNDLNYAYLQPSEDEIVASFDAPVGTPGLYFDYSNQMYAAAGYSAVRSKYNSGTLLEDYRRAMKTYVFDPLEMTSTTTDVVGAMQQDANYAHPLFVTPNGLTEIPKDDFYYTALSVAPAGAVMSNIDDMMKYTLEHINTTDPQVLERLKPIILDSEASGEVYYGMGLNISEVGIGDKTITEYEHGGGSTGCFSDFAFYPHEKMGIAIFINTDMMAPYYAMNFIMNKFFFQALHPANDYTNRISLTDDQWNSLRDDDMDVSMYVLHPSETLINQIVGSYTSGTLGDVIIRAEGDRLFYEAVGLWESEIHYYAASTQYFCLTTNPSVSGLCAKIKRSGGKVTGFQFDYGAYGFDHSFTKVSD